MRKRSFFILGTAALLGLNTAVPAFAANASAASFTRGQVTASSLNVRSGTSTGNSVIGGLRQGDSVKVVSATSNGWYKIRYSGSSAYVYADYINTSGNKVKVSKSNDSKSTDASSTSASDWNGPVLNKSNGTVTGPSGKETYYNMDMSNIVSMMHSRGYNLSYHVREDGVKMLGDYVMVAANLSVHPRGSKVATSLGTGIVCDTGGFAAHNPNQLDIAVAW